MGWFIGLLVFFLVMAISKKTTGHPMAFLGVVYLGFCAVLVGGAVLKMIGVH